MSTGVEVAALDHKLKQLGHDAAKELDEKLIDVLTQILPFIGYPRTLNGLAAINEIAPAEAS